MLPAGYERPHSRYTPTGPIGYTLPPGLSHRGMGGSGERHAMTLLIGLALAAGAATQERPAIHPMVEDLARCRSATADSARLACLDLAAGSLVATTRSNKVVVTREVKRTRQSLSDSSVNENDVFSGRAARAERIEQLRIALSAMVETCAGVLALADIARAADANGLTALVAGTNDLAQDMRCRPDAAPTPFLPAL
ncbi:MAG: malyl-CoA thiolesterase [Sphingomonas bacterium]|nr:malyl-CoA thiolesterase [Sphingomonas bacterium]